MLSAPREKTLKPTTAYVLGSILRTFRLALGCARRRCSQAGRSSKSHASNAPPTTAYVRLVMATMDAAK